MLENKTVLCVIFTAETQIIETMGSQWMMAVKIQFIFIYQKLC